MLDINFIRHNPEKVAEAAKNKRIEVDVDKILTLDKLCRELNTKSDALRAKRNEFTKEIQAAAGGKKEELRLSVQEIKKELTAIEDKMAEVKTELDGLLLTVPSVPDSDVPVGKTEDDNVELRKVGILRKFDFKPKDHLELCQDLDLLDTAGAVKVAGSRSYMLKNDGMLLQMAVTRYVVDFLVARGYMPVDASVLVRPSAMQGTGYFPIGKDQAYYIGEDDLFLAGTSEVSLVGRYTDEIMPAAKLPVKMVGLSTCFRREAGAAGRDTRGLYRVHQFQKVEQVIICKKDDADVYFAELLKNAEDILTSLGLPYRVALACTGEIGLGQTKKCEVETWMPSREGYCETHSCSKLGDFQARRLNIRYKDEGGVCFAHTLNNTAIASPRILIPILETYQNKDGSVSIPDVLVPYMGKKTIKAKG